MKSTPQAYTSFATEMARIHNLTFTGAVVDAPEGDEVTFKLNPCKSDPENPLKCVVAKNASMHPEMFGEGFLDAYIESNKAFTAHADESGEAFYLKRWGHDGAWVVNALDSKDPVRIAQMRRKVERNADITFMPPPPKVSHKAKPKPKAEGQVAKPRVKRATRSVTTRRQRMADMASKATPTSSWD